MAYKSTYKLHYLFNLKVKATAEICRVQNSRTEREGTFASSSDKKICRKKDINPTGNGFQNLANTRERRSF